MVFFGQPRSSRRGARRGKPAGDDRSADHPGGAVGRWAVRSTCPGVQTLGRTGWSTRSEHVHAGGVRPARRAGSRPSWRWRASGSAWLRLRAPAADARASPIRCGACWAGLHRHGAQVVGRRALRAGSSCAATSAWPASWPSRSTALLARLVPRSRAGGGFRRLALAGRGIRSAGDRRRRRRPGRLAQRLAAGCAACRPASSATTPLAMLVGVVV